MSTHQINDLKARLEALIAAKEGQHVNEVSREDLELAYRLARELAGAWQLQAAYLTEELIDLKGQLADYADVREDDYEQESSMFEEQYENEQFAQDNDAWYDTDVGDEY